MSSINKVQIMGRLGADPEVRRLNNGDICVNMRLATSEVWRDKNTGEKKERTEWHTVVIFNQNLAKVAEQYLKKGNLVYVEGMLCTRSWEDQAGQKRWSTEVVLKAFNGDLVLMPQGSGGRPGASGPDDYGQESGRTERSQPVKPLSAGEREMLDDEIPF
jgi:single-strand DNA-binding protein